MFDEGKLIFSIRLLRSLSALVEISAVVLMFRLTRLDSLVRVNTALGLVGPAIFLLVSVLGVVGMAPKLNPWKFALLAAGLVLVMLGTRAD